MLHRRVLRQCRILAAGGFAVISLALTGCAIVDKYSDRAVEYNLQAEKTQQQNLLLNIVRASLRRPMQFTGLTSITGTASASGSLSGGYTNQHQAPYISLFPPSIATPPNSQTAITRVITGTGTGTASMSGGPTFTVPVLDTQEFYQGILTPLSAQVVDYYVKQGYHPEILFDLFVSGVEVISITGCERFTFKNDPRDVVSFSQFQALADYLLGSGFTTERISETRPYGPPIPSSNPEQAALLVEAYSRAAAAGLEFGRGRQAAPEASSEQYTLQKRTSRYRFCFNRNIDQRPDWLGPLENHVYCGQASVRDRISAERIKQATQARRCGIVVGEQGGGEGGGTSQFFDIKLAPALLERMWRIRREHEASYHSPENFFPVHRFAGKEVTFRFHSRSVEGILYYLGEITRQNLNLDGGEPRTVQVKTNLRYGTIPQHECSGSTHEPKSDFISLSRRRPDPRWRYNCDNLFTLEIGASPGAFYTVTYDGVTYSIPTDSARAGRTLQVLELVKQLLALHTSAKSLPQSAVFSLIGGAQ